MHRRSSVLILFLLVCSPTRVSAWGGEGHQVVALIAESRLTAEAKAGIRELLEEGVDISDAEVVNWADEIRRTRRRTAPWHYVNIPYDADGYEAERDGNSGDNIVDRIESFERMLADKSLPKEARAEALKFLVHFVADLHQPLHCIDRNGDKGGNKCLVFMPTQKGKASNLHTVWDTTLLRRYVGRVPVAAYSEALVNRIKNEEAMAWATGTAATWANEAHATAREHSYAGVPATETTRLTEQYVEASTVIVEQQLQRAGVRLSVLLNRSFAVPTATTQSSGTTGVSTAAPSGTSGK